ncbi:hypothetical protein [Aquimarina sp. I32.4]|uniref:hypothetical protein n=1 Tax=Aquimarina sp. I32.4 TaxID=2053903 RepID=UPI0011AF16A7|nr:hypothetical protein [Aquimarina sp. I32.4]
MNIKLNFLLMLLVSILIVSCSKDKIEDTTMQTPENIEANEIDKQLQELKNHNIDKDIVFSNNNSSAYNLLPGTWEIVKVSHIGEIQNAGFGENDITGFRITITESSLYPNKLRLDGFTGEAPYTMEFENMSLYPGTVGKVSLRNRQFVRLLYKDRAIFSNMVNDPIINYNPDQTNKSINFSMSTDNRYFYLYGYSEVLKEQSHITFKRV